MHVVSLGQGQGHYKVKLSELFMSSVLTLERVRIV